MDRPCQNCQQYFDIRENNGKCPNCNFDNFKQSTYTNNVSIKTKKINMKYKLINIETKEEHLCDKVTIDGFDYYVRDEQPKIDGELYHCKHKGKGIDVGKGQPPQRLIINIYKPNRNLCSDCKKVIATNNPSIDLPQVVDEVEELSIMASNKIVIDRNGNPDKTLVSHYKEGYNKSQETHPFSEEDMKDFLIYSLGVRLYQDKGTEKTPDELLQLWEEERTKIIYYK